MNYFQRDLPREQDIEICLDNISKEIDFIYNKTTKKNDDFIRLHSSTLGKDEFLAFSKTILEGNITLGKYNNDYENIAKEKFNSHFCVSSNSGSSANLLAISALVQSHKLKKGDKVIVPGLAWSTTVFPLVQHGLIPIYVDMCPKTFNLNTKDVEKCIKEHKVSAIMLIHTYGNPADLEFFKNFCESNSILLIEDSCESMGATWENKPVGSFGFLGTFSSYYSHHICTLEGGLTICNDQYTSDLMRSIRSHGWTRGIDFDLSKEKNIDNLDPNFLFINSGYNLRLSDPQAAVGCVQLLKLNSFVEKRRKAAEHFIKIINNSSLLSSHIKYPIVLEKASSSWFGFPMIFEKINSEDIKKLRENLLKFKIETRPFLSGDFSLQPVNTKFKNISFNSLPNLKICHGNSFALPCHQDIRIEDVNKICSLIESFLLNI